jgi:hypothetical protein
MNFRQCYHSLPIVSGAKHMNAFSNSCAMRSFRTGSRFVASAESSQKEVSSATFERPNFDVLGGKYSETTNRGGGGVRRGAPTKSARSESPHEILFQISRPTKLVVLSKKKARFGTATQSRSACERTFS